MSAAYHVPAVACPACGQAWIEGQGGRRKAVLLSWRTREIARLWCRGCGHRWRLPVRLSA